MKKSQKYKRPEMSIIEIMGKDGVMMEIGSEGNPGQLSRSTNTYDDADPSRSHSTIWDDDEEE